MLTGKIALVTGGASGIGAAASKLLAKNGAHVIVTSEQPLAAMQKICDEIIAAGGTASAVICDVTKHSSIGETIARIENTHGRLDCLVNCAGVFHRAPWWKRRRRKSP